MSAWTEHVARWKDCTKCPLCHQRDRIVIAKGQVPCDMLFIGEAPGASEDALGLPFVGPAGKLLDAIIASTLRGPEQQAVRVAFTNLVCCFPREAKAAGDNEPATDEILACQPRLKEFIKVANPRLVVAVGTLAEAFVPLDPSRGRASIDHPAHLLRMPVAQREMAAHHCVVQIRCALEAAGVIQ